MSGRWLSFAGAMVLFAAVIGCGKKNTKQEDTGSGSQAPRPGLPPMPGPGSVPTPPKKEPPKIDFDAFLSDMKTFAGKKKTDTAPAGSTTLHNFTQAFPPGHERSAAIYKAMIETADKLEAKDRSQYIYWAARYAGKENLNDLFLIARNYVSAPATCSAAFTRLAELNEPSSFPAIAAMLNDKEGLLRLESAKTLKAIGAPAEKAMQPYAGLNGPDGKPNDFLLRTQAVQIFGAIGTAESLTMLQMLLKDPNSTVAMYAQQAIDAIKAREK